MQFSASAVLTVGLLGYNAYYAPSPEHRRTALVGAVAAFLVGPFTAFILGPINSQLLNISRTGNEARAAEVGLTLLRQWDTRHLIRCGLFGTAWAAVVRLLVL